ncbi:MAG: hypothetical protein IJ318_03020 [Clostridia bacterium]|nr:hypothetical protein [Clostridia bacterium]
MINKLREKNIQLQKKFEQASDSKNVTVQKVISQLLADDDCFFKMSIEHAYAILRELNVKPEKFEKIYLELTKPKN